MNKLFTLLLLFTFAVSTAFADDDAFKRIQEAANPTPNPDSKLMPKSKKYKIPYKIQSQSKFINVNTIEEEDDVFPTQNESSISVNPANPEILIGSSVDYRDSSSTWVYVSSDGGRTWINKNLGRAHYWRSTNDPSVMFDKDGTGYLVHGAFPFTADGKNGVYIHRTTDNGESWVSHIPVIEHTGEMTPDSNFEDKYYIHVDNSDDSPYRGHIYIPWKRMTTADSATQIVMAKSTDKGDTWSQPVNISDRLPGSSEDTTFGQSFPLIATGPEGTVYCVWNHGIEHGVGYSISTDGGETWSEPEIIHNYNIFGTTKKLNQGWRHTVKGNVRAEAYPVVRTDYSDSQYRGNVYLTWSADSVPNVYFSKSTDKGETWSDPVIVHSDTKNDQFWEWMAVDPTSGDIAIMYLDSRNDPDNILVECYVSLSTDGGETWIDRKVSDVQSDLRNNPFEQNAFAGDYSGLDFYDGVLYPSWVDMRNTTDIYTRDNDVYTAIVRVDQPSPVNNFNVKIIPDDPTKLDLSWNTELESTFGKMLSNEEVELELYRDDELINTLSSGTEEYTDTELIPYQRYDYKIRAVTENDSSIFRIDFSYAGGSEQPAAPEILSNEITINRNSGDEDFVQTVLEVELPKTRADNETILTNLSGIEFYGNGELVHSESLEPLDAGETLEFELPYELNDGYMNLNAKAVTKYNEEEQRSDTSNTVFVYNGDYLEVIAEKDKLEINFEDKNEGYFTESWEITNEISYSPNTSVATSPNGDYKINQEKSIYLKPTETVVTTGSTIYHYTLSIYHICNVHKIDSAVIEISNDMKEWRQVASFNSEDHTPWQDKDLTNEDWKFEKIDLLFGKNAGGEVSFNRIRFKSNGFLNDLGWYVDDIELIPDGVVGVDSEKEISLELYPNPTSRFVNVKFDNENDYMKSIKVFDLTGSKVFESKFQRNEVIDLQSLNTGVYLIELITGNNNRVMKKVNLIR